MHISARCGPPIYRQLKNDLGQVIFFIITMLLFRGWKSLSKEPAVIAIATSSWRSVFIQCMERRAHENWASLGKLRTATVLAANRPPPTPPPEGKLPHRRMQRSLPAELLAAADSLQKLSLSGVTHVSEVPPIYLIIIPTPCVLASGPGRFLGGRTAWCNPFTHARTNL